MLYALYKTQRSFLDPLADLASATSKLYGLVPGARGIVAGAELLHRLAKDYKKPEFAIPTAPVVGRDVSVREQVALSKPFCRLVRFKRFTDDAGVLEKLKAQPTVLLVAPLSGNHATLLRDTVSALLPDHKLFITDWTDARMVPAAEGPFHLADYIEYLQQFMRHIGPDAHVVSVCQPTVPALAAIALMASRGEPTPRSMTMMAGPIDARKSPTAVNKLATTRSYAWFERSMIYRVPGGLPGAGRRVYPGFLQHTSFVAMNPKRHFKAHCDYFLDVALGNEEEAEAHRKFYDEYNAVLDMPAEYYLDTVKTVFQEFALARGSWKVRGEPVRPQDISKTALLTVEGELDDISGAGQTQAAHALCERVPEARKRHFNAPKVGHYGVFAGSRWREVIYPEVRAFIREFDR